MGKSSFGTFDINSAKEECKKPVKGEAKNSDEPLKKPKVRDPSAENNLGVNLPQNARAYDGCTIVNRKEKDIARISGDDVVDYETHEPVLKILPIPAYSALVEDNKRLDLGLKQVQGSLEKEVEANANLSQKLGDKENEFKANLERIGLQLKQIQDSRDKQNETYKKDVQTYQKTIEGLKIQANNDKKEFEKKETEFETKILALEEEVKRKEDDIAGVENKRLEAERSKNKTNQTYEALQAELCEAGYVVFDGKISPDLKSVKNNTQTEVLLKDKEQLTKEVNELKEARKGIEAQYKTGEAAYKKEFDAKEEEYKNQITDLKARAETATAQITKLEALLKAQSLPDEKPADEKSEGLADNELKLPPPPPPYAFEELAKKVTELERDNLSLDCKRLILKEAISELYETIFGNEDMIEDYENTIECLQDDVYHASVGKIALLKGTDVSVTLCELVTNLSRPKLRVVEKVGEEIKQVSTPQLGRTYAIEIDTKVDASGFKPYRAYMTVFHKDGKTKQVKFEKTMRAGIVDMGSGEYTIRSRDNEPFVFGRTLDCSTDIVEGNVEILLIPEKTKVYK
ncbi:MAG: hypothetical protein PHC66_03830 [Candidatus Nanoarchaeia archaeon]|nr:hypothetical protein [Candidatus Nanoarchaeia archaeon]MDD5239225.1 hypothetical protein [Candidatus Nanoarchaeia archaeon]